MAKAQTSGGRMRAGRRARRAGSLVRGGALALVPVLGAALVLQVLGPFEGTARAGTAPAGAFALSAAVFAALQLLLAFGTQGGRFARGRDPRHAEPRPPPAPAALLVARLAREVRTQGRRANLNLVLGGLAAAASLAFLGRLAWTAGIDLAVTGQKAARPAGGGDHLAMLYWGAFLARAALSAAAGGFAFFFLSTYRRSLGEIRYFENELTNVQLRLIALEMSDRPEFAQTRREILLNLARTERNFVLRAGETTAELALSDLDRAETAALAGLVGDSLKAVGETTKRAGIGP